MLQRHLDIPFSRATEIIDQMHEEGVVGPQLPSGRREVLVAEQELVGSSRDPLN
jgi:DNA segregation ATPase FtsK/SpoIIIE-like protein